MAFAVCPKDNCPHNMHLDFQDIIYHIKNKNINSKVDCGICCIDKSFSQVIIKENWFCLSCKDVFCSRYVNGHMESHYLDNKDCNGILLLYDIIC